MRSKWASQGKCCVIWIAGYEGEDVALARLVTLAHRCPRAGERLGAGNGRCHPVADVNALLAGVAFTPTANFNGSFSIATSVSDGLAPAITGTKAFTGTAVNDAPTISNLAVSATSISFVASDPDNATLSLASPFASAFGNPVDYERCHH